MSERRGIPLQLKVTVAVVVLVMVPLAVSAYFVGEIGRTAANYASSEEASHPELLVKSIETTRELVFETKRLHGEIANRLAHQPEILALDPTQWIAQLEDMFGIDTTHDLAAIIADPAQAGLRGLEVLAPDGTVVAEAEKRPTGAGWIDLDRYEALGDGGSRLHLIFEVPDVNADIDKLKQAIDVSQRIQQIKSTLPESYRNAFLVIISIAGVIAAGLGIFASTLVTRRIAALVATARKVSEGHLDARVELHGRDEMAQLGGAFNTMLDDLDETRKQIEYLQRMGVWQDVARRLAHEIKNPLTPIQLAVQECVSQYKGDDAKFKKLLVATGEIVEEEIEGLRRLVDTFRTLGALPKVEAVPLQLADVIEELRLDPTIASRLELQPPPEPVTVRADKLLLKRVLVNLVENGIHAGQEAGNEGRVAIGWFVNFGTNQVQIVVDDHGKGVDADAREKIFEPYVTTKSTGTGLGLAIARKIAIEHGGELGVAAIRAPTGGARFIVSLPLRTSDTSAG